jgi:hypothetical protein
MAYDVGDTNRNFGGIGNVGVDVSEGWSAMEQVHEVSTGAESHIVYIGMLEKELHGYIA